MSGKIILLGTVMVEGKQHRAYKLDNGTVKWFTNLDRPPVVANIYVAKTFIGRTPNRRTK